MRNSCVKAILKVFPAPLWDVALAISQAESGRQDYKVGINSDGSVDRGCMQINSVHKQFSPSLLMDAEYNVRAALQIYHASGWHPWTTYESGKYKAYLP